MIRREHHQQEIAELLEDFPVVAILGARQVGKTTLARQILNARPSAGERFDLESPADLARLEDPELALTGMRGLVVLDEIQRRPNLFPVLRVLADRRPIRARFLVLGSASPELLRQTSETLAGRIAFYTLPGFSLDEVGEDNLDRLWLRGGFPSSLLARTEDVSFTWRENFIRTFVERDLPQLGVRTAGRTLSRFWSMLAHYHGQIWNSSEFARSFGVTYKTVQHYLDILTASFVVQPFPPWHANVKKRQVKAPKVYIRDSGLLHALLGLRERRDLERHPKVGASWEGFVLQQLVQKLGAKPEECYFWATHAGAELDFLWVRGGRCWGFEIKRTVAPKLTKSMRSAMETLELERLFVVHAGEGRFALGEGVEAVGFDGILGELLM
ncbi:MAG: ATP-binding protein [bacterium]|nr:ATP-binding protein [bacterium]